VCREGYATHVRFYLSTDTLRIPYLYAAQLKEGPGLEVICYCALRIRQLFVVNKRGLLRGGTEGFSQCSW